MSLKKMIMLGTIIAGLASPAYAKMYEKGLSSDAEKQYKIDLIGEFSDEAIPKIENVMKKIDEKVNRKACGIEYLTLENTENLGKQMQKDADIEKGLMKYAGATIDAKKNLIKMDSKAIESRANEEFPLCDYEGILAHEIGHLVYFHKSESEQDKIWRELEQLSVQRDRYKEGKIPDGYVSEYPLTRCFFVRPTEDFAETFSYKINDKTYADSDNIVNRKIKVIEKCLKNQNETKID